MIAKLEKEAEAEATEKAYCDEEMSKTEAKKGELETLQAELAALAKEQASMDSIRAEEKAAYDKAKAELEAGIGGVQKALGVLRDYYGGGAALLQKAGAFDAFMQQPAAPEKHSAAGGAGGSIIDILEVVESDFTKNLADEENQEANALAEYEKTTQDNKLANTMKTQ